MKRTSQWQEELSQIVFVSTRQRMSYTKLCDVYCSKSGTGRWIGFLLSGYTVIVLSSKISHY